MMALARVSVAGLVMFGVAVAVCQAQEPITSATCAPLARVITVALPLTGNDDQRVKAQVSQFLTEQSRPEERPILVLEFRAARLTTLLEGTARPSSGPTPWAGFWSVTN